MSSGTVYRDLNLLDRYSFRSSIPAAGVLRPLRDPDAPEDTDDEGGVGSV